MSRIRETLENWRIRGAPRCYAHDGTRLCQRVIWPWQRAGGDGESAQHWDCMIRERAWLDHLDMDDPDRG